MSWNPSAQCFALTTKLLWCFQKSHSRHFCVLRILLQGKPCSQQGNCREEEIKNMKWNKEDTVTHEINWFLFFEPHVSLTIQKLDKPVIQQRLYFTQHMQHITNNPLSHHHHIDLTKYSVMQSRLTTNFFEVTFKWWQWLIGGEWSLGLYAENTVTFTCSVLVCTVGMHNID